MAWSDAARAAAAEARRRNAAHPTSHSVGGKRIRLRAIYRTADTIIPEHKVKVGGKVLTIRAAKVRGFLKYK